MAFETYFSLRAAFDNVIGFVDRMAANTRQIFGFMGARKPMHTVIAFVAAETDIVTLLD